MFAKTTAYNNNHTVKDGDLVDHTPFLKSKAKRDKSKDLLPTTIQDQSQDLEALDTTMEDMVGPICGEEDEFDDIDQP